MLTLRAQAVLFDMDGTLVDSSAAVEGAWRAFAELHGLDFQAVVDHGRGRQPADTLAHFLPDLADPAATLAELDRHELAHLEAVVPVPGAPALLAQLAQAPTALVTSATLELALSRMRTAGLPIPRVVIPAEQAAGKPSPEGYLLAAAALAVAPADCVVFEDSPAGVEAGLAAGAQVVVVGRHAPPGDLPCVDDLRQVSAVVADGAIRLCLPACPA